MAIAFGIVLWLLLAALGFFVGGCSYELGRRLTARYLDRGGKL